MTIEFVHFFLDFEIYYQNRLIDLKFNNLFRFAPRIQVIDIYHKPQIKYPGRLVNRGTKLRMNRETRDKIKYYHSEGDIFVLNQNESLNKIHQSPAR